MSAAGNRRRAQAGFTALELMVAMAVLALLTGLAAPLFSTIADAVRFRVAARAVGAELRAARGLALRSDAPVVIAFDAEGHGYGTPGGAWIALPEGILLRWQAGALASDPARLGFFPDGSSTGGTLMLAGPRHAAGIAIDPLSGRFATLTGRR